MVKDDPRLYYFESFCIVTMKRTRVNLIKSLFRLAHFLYLLCLAKVSMIQFLIVKHAWALIVNYTKIFENKTSDLCS